MNFSFAGPSRIALARRRLYSMMRCLVLSLGVVGTPMAAYADNIPLFNTGVDNTGSLLALGSADTHWSVVAGPGITSPIPAVVITNQSPSGLYAQSPNSRWIWVNASAVGAFNSPYTFQSTFDLTGLDPTTATISGSWGVDNEGQILLNGATPVGTGALSIAIDPIGFQVLRSFTITGGFVSGLNTLQFQATDVGVVGALNATELVGSASVVPEPSQAALLGCGAIALLFLVQRRKARKELPTGA
jgi:hypothetical protein